MLLMKIEQRQNMSEENNPQNNQQDNLPQQHWYEAQGIDQALLNDKIKGFPDVNGLLKSYNEAQSFIGRGIPDDNTPDDIKNAFYAKLGRPDSPEKYEWQPPEGVVVEGVTDSEFKAFKELAFKAGLSNKQLGAVMGGWSDIVRSLQDKQAKFLSEQSQATVSALKREWGDDYERRLNLTLKKLDSIGVRKGMEAAGFLSADALKGFYSMISGKEETSLIGANGQQIGKDERIRQLQSNPAYLNSSHPDHAKIVKELNELHDAN